MKVLEAVLSAPWLILPQNLEDLLAIAARESEWTPETLEKYRANRLERSERATKRGDVAILNVHGALFKRANLFVEICGATSYDILSRDLQAAFDNPAIKAICLNIDSPGGMASGCDEFAQAVFEARGKKPITAYVTGAACSAAYWIASAADRIVMSDSSMVGSIGVVMTIPKNTEKGTEIVSSNAPGKRPDVETDAGRSRIQQIVDDLETVFISAVARNRGVSEDTVKQKFGSGGVEIGAKAVALGMADKVGQFEQVLADLQKSTPNSKITSRRTANMNSFNNGAQLSDTAQKDRLKAILTSEIGRRAPELAQHFAFNTDMSAEAALEAMNISQTAYQSNAERQLSPEDAYFRRKANAGTLGAADSAPSATGRRAMTNAVEKLNAKFEAENVR